jgi:hypothetical protein
MMVTIILCLPSAGWPEMVHYVDENGKVHYVNTDYQRVPPQYSNQVQSQLRKDTPITDASPDEEQKEESQPTTEPAIEEVPSVSAIDVDVFVSADCEECPRLLQELAIQKVSYHRYDVVEHSYGRRMLIQYPGALPFTKVGNLIIRGSNTKDILSAIAIVQKRWEIQQPQAVDAGVPPSQNADQDSKEQASQEKTSHQEKIRKREKKKEKKEKKQRDEKKYP